MENKRFYNERIQLTDDHSISFPILLGGLVVLVYIFGFGFISGFTTTLLLQVIVFVFAASLAWSLATQGIFKTIRNIVAFLIAMYLIIQMIEAAPDYIFKIDVSGYEKIINIFDSSYSGHVEFGGENGIQYNPEGNTPNFYAPPATEIPQQNSSAIMIATPVPSTDGTTVFTTTPTLQPTVDILSQMQNETYGYIQRDMIDQAFNSAAETYGMFNDDYSFNIVADIQQARDIKTNRLTNLPIATSSSTSFQAGGEQDRTENLLIGNTWLIVSAGEGFGMFSCQKNLVIEQKDGLLAGSQFTVKECTLKGLSEDGKIGTTFNGGV